MWCQTSPTTSAVSQSRLTLTVFTAEPDSPSAVNLNLLATWAATLEADASTQPLSRD